MRDIRLIRKDGQSADPDDIRQRFLESAARSGVNEARATALWQAAMRGERCALEVIQDVCDIEIISSNAGFGFSRMSFMRRYTLMGALALCSSSVSAAGVDSRAYTCDGLHALVATSRFVFINYPSFMDFVVANSSYCSGGEVIQLRSVPTSDNAECPLNRCRNHAYSN